MFYKIEWVTLVNIFNSARDALRKIYQIPIEDPSPTFNYLTTG